MKIKTQCIACIAIFSVILIVIAASVAITDQGVKQLDGQHKYPTKLSEPQAA